MVEILRERNRTAKKIRVYLYMSILVNTQNEQEEKVLLAFLDSLRYSYQSDIGNKADQITAAYLEQYNKEIDQADAEIEAGNFVNHQDVEQIFKRGEKLFK